MSCISSWGSICSTGSVRVGDSFLEGRRGETMPLLAVVGRLYCELLPFINYISLGSILGGLEIGSWRTEWIRGRAAWP
jgi:hypothetical protein